MIFLVSFFFQSNWPTQYQEMHPMLNEKKRGMAKRFCSLWSSGTKLSYSSHVENTKHTQKNWLHLFFTWLFLYHKEVSRVFSSTSNIAWQFSYQWHRHCAILLQTQIHMYANLVRTKFDTHTVLISSFKLLQVLLSSWCSEWKVQLYFPRDLSLNFRVAKNFFNNFFMTWAQKEFAYLL